MFGSVQGREERGIKRKGDRASAIRQTYGEKERKRNGQSKTYRHGLPKNRELKNHDGKNSA